MQHRSALDAAVSVLPLTVLAPIAGRVTAQLGPRPMMLAGLLLAAAGVASIAMWATDTAHPVLQAAMLGWGIGIGLLTPALVAAAVAAAPPARSGLASGVNNTAREARRRDRTVGGGDGESRI